MMTEPSFVSSWGKDSSAFTTMFGCVNVKKQGGL